MAAPREFVSARAMVKTGAALTIDKSSDLPSAIAKKSSLFGKKRVSNAK
jgi:hypothetical protein